MDREPAASEPWHSPLRVGEATESCEELRRVANRIGENASTRDPPLDRATPEVLIQLTSSNPSAS